ncbi:uncharacterized protein [Heliangelus exortis]|uniref:uncharacterized protein n=1 Tax=Heliangelus exortis TaxID=472823 RepID=UPI003A942CCF
MLFSDQRVATRNVPQQHTRDTFPRGRSAAGADARCKLPSSFARPLLPPAGNGESEAGAAAGRGGRSPVLEAPGALWAELQLCCRIGGVASAVLWFTSKGSACISARPRRKELQQAAVRLTLPMHPLLALARGSLAVTARKKSSARQRPGTGLAPRLQPRSGGAPSRSRRVGTGGCSPEWSGRSGQEELDGIGAVGGAAGRLQSLWQPLCPGARRGRWGKRRLCTECGRERGAPCRVQLLPINYRASFFPFSFFFFFSVLLLCS